MATTSSGGSGTTPRRTGLLLVLALAVGLVLIVGLWAFNRDGADDVARSGTGNVAEPEVCEEGDDGDFNVASGAEC